MHHGPMKIEPVQSKMLYGLMTMLVSRSSSRKASSEMISFPRLMSECGWRTARETASRSALRDMVAQLKHIGAGEIPLAVAACLKTRSKPTPETKYLY